MLLDDLNKQIEKWFHCMEGPPLAYFEIPTTRELGTYRFVYQMIGYQMATPFQTPDDIRRAQDALVTYLHRDFEAAYRSFTLPDDPNELRTLPLLFWRRKLGFTVEEGFARLSCRLVIPGYMFPKSSCPDEGSWTWPRINGS